MQSGKLNKRLVISQLVTGSPAVNSVGEPNTSWGEIDTVWAAIEPVSGREFWAQQQVQSEVTVKIRIRYRSDVSVGMKGECAGRTYLIQNIIDPLEAHRELLLMCSEGVINV